MVTPTVCGMLLAFGLGRFRARDSLLAHDLSAVGLREGRVREIGLGCRGDVGNILSIKGPGHRHFFGVWGRRCRGRGGGRWFSIG